MLTKANQRSTGNGTHMRVSSSDRQYELSFCGVQVESNACALNGPGGPGSDATTPPTPPSAVMCSAPFSLSCCARNWASAAARPVSGPNGAMCCDLDRLQHATNRQQRQSVDRAHASRRVRRGPAAGGRHRPTALVADQREVVIELGDAGQLAAV